MIMTAPLHNTQTTSLLKRLPTVRGKLRENVPLANLTWFRVGGVAEIMFRPLDKADLADFLTNCPEDIPITVLGATSNILIRDGGISGVVIRMLANFGEITLLEDNVVYAGSAALDGAVAKFCAENELGGLEFLSGIPGSIGGGLKMNAGAYDAEFKDVLLYADAIGRDGTCYRWTPEQMDMQYRSNEVPDGTIFVGAAFKSKPDSKINIEKKMLEIKTKREASQPVREKTGGSTFANPCRDNPKIRKHAWQLIDEAGCRGLVIGGAKMSEKHCNFMINTGNATAYDLETLGETVRMRVLEISGINLRWEIRRIGVDLEK